MIDPLSSAQRYADAGRRVAPITPGKKYPPFQSWQTAATVDPATIEGWWGPGGEYEGFGVCIATGAGSGVFVVDIDDFDVWEEHFGFALPKTATVETGSGGVHLYFKVPAGVSVTNANTFPAGIDVRGDGGQVLAPPTVHPDTGAVYKWINELEPADPPDWILEHVVAQESSPVAPPPPPAAVSDRPGDEYAAAIDWGDLLEPDGWTLHHQDGSGERHWTRPGKQTRDGTSATTDYKGSGGLKVFTSSLTGWGLSEGASYSKLGYLAATRFGGDHSAAASWLRTQGFGDQPTSNDVVFVGDALAGLPAAPELPPEPDDDDGVQGWQPTDLKAVLSGDWRPPTPSVVERDDGVCMFYQGRLHSIAGEPGCGKTWLALSAIQQTIAAGRTALMIDWEDTPGSFVTRLRQLGATDRQIADHAVYIRPDLPLMSHGGMTVYGAHSLLNIIELEPALVVIDSVGEALAGEGIDSNDDGPIAVWTRLLPRRLAQQCDSTIIMLDHVPKNAETRGNWAIGSQRKLAAIDGAAFTVQAVTAPTREDDGRLKVTCAKDRHGTHRRGWGAAEVEVRNGVVGPGAEVGSVDVLWRAPWNPDSDGHTIVQEKVVAVLNEHDELSGNRLEKLVGGKSATVRAAIGELRDSGRLKVRAGGKGGGLMYTLTGRFDDSEVF